MGSREGGDFGVDIPERIGLGCHVGKVQIKALVRVVVSAAYLYAMNFSDRPGCMER